MDIKYWLAIYVGGFLISWFSMLRFAGDWKIDSTDHEVYFDLTGEDWGMCTFFAAIWVVAMPIVLILMAEERMNINNLIGGRKPKKLLVEAHDRKVEKLLEEEPIT